MQPFKDILIMHAEKNKYPKEKKTSQMSFNIPVSPKQKNGDFLSTSPVSHVLYRVSDLLCLDLSIYQSLQSQDNDISYQIPGHQCYAVLFI